MCRNVKWIQHSPLLDTLPFHWFKYRSACWTWHNFACHHHISLCCECATFGRNQRNFLNHKFQVNVRKSEAKEMSVYKTKHEHLHGPYLPCEKLHVPQIHCVDNGAIRFRNRQILTECERITRKKGPVRSVCVSFPPEHRNRTGFFLCISDSIFVKVRRFVGHSARIHYWTDLLLIWGAAASHAFTRYSRGKKWMHRD